MLQHRDVAALRPDEKALLDAMIRDLAAAAAECAGRTVVRRGGGARSTSTAPCVRRCARWASRAGSSTGVAGPRPRRVVLLVDVSASMRPYADALLRLAHLWSTTGARGRVEVFTLGHPADPDHAAAAHERPRAGAGPRRRAGAGLVGGTRLGETMKAFLDRWGARGMARGAVVVVFSDGWERGDAAELGEQMERLQRLAHRVVWVNPHRGKEGYEPVQRGIAAALPHCDDFVAGHSLRAFAEVLEVVGRA